MKIDAKRLTILFRDDISFSILYAEGSTDQFQASIEETFSKNKWEGMTFHNVMLCLAELCLAIVRCEPEKRSYIFAYVGI